MKIKALSDFDLFNNTRRKRVAQSEIPARGGQFPLSKTACRNGMQAGKKLNDGVGACLLHLVLLRFFSSVLLLCFFVMGLWAQNGASEGNGAFEEAEAIVILENIKVLANQQDEQVATEFKKLYESIISSSTKRQEYPQFSQELAALLAQVATDGSTEQIASMLPEKEAAEYYYSLAGLHVFLENYSRGLPLLEKAYRLVKGDVPEKFELLRKNAFSAMALRETLGESEKPAAVETKTEALSFKQRLEKRRKLDKSVFKKLEMPTKDETNQEMEQLLPLSLESRQRFASAVEPYESVQAQVSQRNYDEAVEVLADLVVNNPQFYEAVYALALVSLLKKDYENANRYFTQTVELKRSVPRAYLWRAVALADLEKLDEAVDDLVRARAYSSTVNDDYVFMKSAQLIKDYVARGGVSKFTQLPKEAEKKEAEKKNIAQKQELQKKQQSDEKPVAENDAMEQKALNGEKSLVEEAPLADEEAIVEDLMEVEAEDSPAEAESVSEEDAMLEEADEATDETGAEDLMEAEAEDSPAEAESMSEEDAMLEEADEATDEAGAEDLMEVEEASPAEADSVSEEDVMLEEADEATDEAGAEDVMEAEEDSPAEAESMSEEDAMLEEADEATDEAGAEDVMEAEEDSPAEAESMSEEDAMLEEADEAMKELQADLEEI